MREFFEKAYFHELERKSKIQAAAAFPLGIATLSIGLLKFIIENISVEKSCNYLAWVLFIFSLFAMVRMFVLANGFLDFGSYEVISKSDDYLLHFQELKRFCVEHPTAQSPEVTIDEHLIVDFSKCATINAAVNDRRAEQLYELNLTAYMLILSALISAAVLILEMRLG